MTNLAKVQTVYESSAHVEPELLDEIRESLGKKLGEILRNIGPEWGIYDPLQEIIYRTEQKIPLSMSKLLDYSRFQNIFDAILDDHGIESNSEEYVFVVSHLESR